MMMAAQLCLLRTGLSQFRKKSGDQFALGEVLEKLANPLPDTHPRPASRVQVQVLLNIGIALAGATPRSPANAARARFPEHSAPVKGRAIDGGSAAPS